MTDIKTLYIDDLCVDENARGRGIGKGLYNAAQELARSSGCYNLTLNVWCLNESAMRFYESCGLVPQKIGMEKIL
jgi:ribosomal protein S18 acetylase RimI-like enzyme